MSIRNTTYALINGADDIWNSMMAPNAINHEALYASFER